MPDGEEMFYYHGYSGECPKPPLSKSNDFSSADLAAKISTSKEFASINSVLIFQICDAYEKLRANVRKQTN